MWSSLRDLFAGLPDSVEGEDPAEGGDATPCKDFYNLGPMVHVPVSKARRTLFRAKAAAPAAAAVVSAAPAVVSAAPAVVSAVDPAVAAAVGPAGVTQFLESLVASLKQRNQELLGKVYALETDKQVAEAQVAALQHHNEALVGENLFLNKTIDVLQRDLKRSRDRYEDLQGELTDLCHARDNAVERAAFAEQQLADSDVSQARFMKQLADAGYEVAWA